MKSTPCTIVQGQGICESFLTSQSFLYYENISSRISKPLPFFYNALMSKRFDQVVEIMSRLRGEGGCPWDRKQTRESLKPYLIEEAYEVLETIEAQDDPRLKEELGDVLLQILFHAEIGRERRTFTLEDVLETLADKLVRRHPHVFGETTPSPPDKKISAEEVVHRWEEIKRQEKADQSGNGDTGSALDGVPKALPALLRAYQLQVRGAP